MSEVKRFKPVINDKPYKPYAYCEQNDDGIYVRIDDYEELKAERDALAAENGAMRELIGATGFKSETPATDAYLNSVRAEGVKMLAEKMQQTIDNAKLSSDEIGVLAGAIFTGYAIANQLRAGEPS